MVQRIWKKKFECLESGSIERQDQFQLSPRLPKTDKILLTSSDVLTFLESKDPILGEAFSLKSNLRDSI